jgi:hypothetical protein
MPSVELAERASVRLGLADQLRVGPVARLSRTIQMEEPRQVVFGEEAALVAAVACVCALPRYPPRGGARFGRRSCVAGVQLIAAPQRVSGPP